MPGSAAPALSCKISLEKAQWMVVATGETATLGWTPARAMFAALMTVLAAVYLLSTIRLRRRLRAARKDDDRAGVTPG
jgi:C4-dicarboxylate-specific signal transduction histidine kinase